ncbi:hypothetical protein CIHG_10173 [Coccidioides immitis H538.4]|uniref:Conserved oligomeric Golgi complex subunit 5 n=1 Tax=Coccidioides immitis H538.4 TaxID=396776 RepID=A0A0J8S7L2_COCIT|nr:hypothetical protein CIHG_10173 [Coccidioides immitis H538.4]
MAEPEPSYIDYEAFLDPSFSPTSFANNLVTSTNNPSDTPLDLSTPLSRVLFDIQEIDTHIHTRPLNGEEGYGLDRVRVIRTLRSDLITPAENSVKARAQQIVNKFSLKAVFMDEEHPAVSPGPRARSSGATTYAQQEELRARVISAITALYLLSPTPKSNIPVTSFSPELLLATLKGYIHTSLSASLAALTRGLSMLPSLDRALLEVSTRCQHIVALEGLLQTVKPPVHPFLIYPSSEQDGTETQAALDKKKSNLLRPVLQALDTSSLPSYFWRSLASSLSPAVQEIVSRGGVSARTMRSNQDRLREDIRACVLRGSLSSSPGLKREIFVEVELLVVSQMKYLQRIPSALEKTSGSKVRYDSTLHASGWGCGFSSARERIHGMRLSEGQQKPMMSKRGELLDERAPTWRMVGAIL